MASYMKLVCKAMAKSIINLLLTYPYQWDSQFPHYTGLTETLRDLPTN